MHDSEKTRGQELNTGEVQNQIVMIKQGKIVNNNRLMN